MEGSHDGADLEYDRFAAQWPAVAAPVEKHFEEAVRDVKLLDKQRPTTYGSMPKTAGDKRAQEEEEQWPGVMLSEYEGHLYAPEPYQQDAVTEIREFQAMIQRMADKYSSA